MTWGHLMQQEIVESTLAFGHSTAHRTARVAACGGANCSVTRITLRVEFSNYTGQMLSGRLDRPEV